MSRLDARLFPPFIELETVSILKQLAKQPIDLSAQAVLSPERVSHFVSEAVGYKLLYATERVTDEVMQALFRLADERSAVDQMERMQSGATLNYIDGYPSENRSVLHTATRDFFESPQEAPEAKEASSLAKQEVARLETFLKTINQSQQFTDLLMIGIGGSALGPEALYLGLEAFKDSSRHVHFIGNVDPDDTVKKLRGLNLNHTLVCVVSKSGTTLETTVNESFARDYFIRQGLDPQNHFIAVTGEGSPMDNPHAYLERFHIWDWIGGRFSGTSVIGGVVVGFSCGIEVFSELLRGAHAMDQNALTKGPKNNLPLLGALLGIWNHNFMQIPTCAVIPYSQALWRFPAHLQQLEMESNGKQIDKLGRFVDFQTGPIIWGESGTNAQHSFYQSIHQGTYPICLEMIGFAHDQTQEDFDYQGTHSQEKLLANLFAQAIALAVGQTNENPNKVFLGNRPSHLLLANRLTPFALGALLAYFEHKVAFQGFIWNINSFDQEGVQLGKVLANRIIERFKAARGESTSAYPLADAYIRQIRELD